jgi:uncharacterized OB-fold protein
MSYLNPGLPIPVASPDGLDAEYWEGLKKERLLIQRCDACAGWQWGPEWICHRCHGFDLGFHELDPVGRIYSFERVWHPVHPALKDQGPYVVVLVTLDQAEGVRIVGNLLGDPTAEVPVGASVRGLFEHHPDAEPAHTLLHWELA